MKALILSCNTGGGHNSAGRAIAEAMTWRGDEAYVLDYLTLAGEGVSRIVGDGYVQIVKKTPRLFGIAYKLGMGVSRITRKSPVYYMNGRMAKISEPVHPGKSSGCDCNAPSLPCGNHYVYEAKRHEASSHCGSDDRLYLHSLLGRDRCGLLYHSSRKPDKALCEKRAERRKADPSWNPCVQNLQA